MIDERPGKSHSESRCFAVEARMMCPSNPILEVAGQRFDGQWRRVHFERGVIGVPDGLWSAEASERGFLSYTAAMALGYWVLSAAAMQGLEFRLVEYRVVTDSTTTRGRDGVAIQQSYTWELPPAVAAVDPHV